MLKEKIKSKVTDYFTEEYLKRVKEVKKINYFKTNCQKFNKHR